MEGSVTTDSQRYVYDFTWYGDGKEITEETDKYVLQEIAKSCKSYGFQLERCPTTNRLHYQGRISLRTKKRLNEMKKGWLLPGAHWSITSKTCSKGEMFYDYVTKDDTRERGPWTDRDTRITDPIPSHLLECKARLYPFQESIKADAQNINRDQINIICDPMGGKGKSTITLLLGAEGIAQPIPSGLEYKDIIRMVHGVVRARRDSKQPEPRIYLMDIPRSLSHKKQHDIYAALETIKGGYAYDDRYHFRDIYFECPNIWVFTNTIPDANLLSARRWVYWAIDPQMRLVPYYEYINGSSEAKLIERTMVKPSPKLNIVKQSPIPKVETPGVKIESGTGTTTGIIIPEHLIRLANEWSKYDK